eukprot:4781581-Amphidinium_carterae.1
MSVSVVMFAPSIVVRRSPIILNGNEQHSRCEETFASLRVPKSLFSFLENFWPSEVFLKISDFHSQFS